MTNAILVQPVISKTDHKSALKRIETLMDLEKRTRDQEIELETLFVLVSNYEEKHVLIFPPHPIDAILFRMEQQGLTQKDVAKILGSKQRASEYLNKKIPLSIEAIRKLNDSLGISGDILIQKYTTKK
ncbi:helix-turn-helix domain-containing protein [Leptospira sarikeiensis]|uniref:Helix-turn-helix domain-containing protein n=1 Tax=Leptospira sarikeiensis TaxID=2484943 RepID=A0A4R9K7Q4_9LEPT|nr:helix-turn-helix domain-containing protein [Leptospira sarikeiensis]TGL61390.1 helix-turn-helix domain-containing protein [Leptospira sarikeiensis]